MRSSVRSYVVSCLAGCLFAWGCASPKPADTGTAGNSGAGNTTGGGTAGTTGGGNTTGSGTGNTTGAGTAGTTGSGTGNTTGAGTAGSSATGTAGTGGPACVSDPTNLVRSGGWICDLTQPYAIQGAWYGYGDGTSCPASTPNPCTSGACRMMGTTAPPDTTYMRWGCGIGMELSSSGGTAPTKSVYTGSSKCFKITLTGSSGGNVVRIGFTQSAAPPSGSVAPFKEYPAFTAGMMATVCFADVTCPSWSLPPMVATATCAKTGTRRHACRYADPGCRRQHGDDRRRVRRLHQQGRAGGQRQHRHGRLGRRHGQLHDPERHRHDHGAIWRRARDVPEGLHRPEQCLGLHRGPERSPLVPARR